MSVIDMANISLDLLTKIMEMPDFLAMLMRAYAPQVLDNNSYSATMNTNTRDTPLNFIYLIV